MKHRRTILPEPAGAIGFGGRVDRPARNELYSRVTRGVGAKRVVGGSQSIFVQIKRRAMARLLCLQYDNFSRKIQAFIIQAILDFIRGV
jgi:hypothetical protein